MPAVYDPEQLGQKEQNSANTQPGEYTQNPDGLIQAEQAAENPAQHENQVGEGYKSGGHQPSLRSRLIKGRGRKAAVGGSIAALIIAAAIAAFIAFIPLKILHIVNNLQSRFYATAQNAVEKETDVLFSRYVRGKILHGCRGVYIDHTCNPYDGGSFVKKLYRGWSDGKLEQKLRQQTGLEIRHNQRSGRYEMRFAGGAADDFINLNGLRDNQTISQIIDAKGDWTEVKKNQVRGAYKSALKGTTRHPNAMYYIKVTPYLKKKFGIKWCVVGCNKKDDFRDWKRGAINDKKFAAKMYLAERVLSPRFELYEMIMQCIYSGSDLCSRDKVLNATPKNYSATIDGCQDGCIDNGRPVSDSLNKMEAKLVALAAKYGSDYAALRKAFDRFERTGFITALIKNFATTRIDDEGDTRGSNELEDNEEVKKKAEEEARKRNQKISPVRALGWMVMASYLVKFLDESPETIARLQYMANTSAMVQLWGMYRTQADEVKEGETDAEITGSFVTSLGPGLQPTEGDAEQVGGTAGAESTPLYQEIISEGPNTPAGITSVIQSLLTPTALAQEQTAPEYLCADGKAPPAGKLVCAEEFLNGVGWFASALDQLKKLPGWGLLAQAAKAVTGAVDELIGIIFSIISKIPFIGDAISAALADIIKLVGIVAKYTGLGEILQKFASWMLGINLHMVSNNMSGGRTFNMVAAGADVSGNDFAHHGIGGVVLKPEQVSQNLEYFYNQRLAEHQQKSFFARVFDTESPYSTVSRLAVAMPSNTTALTNSVNTSFANFIKNPFGKLANSFASIFTLKTNAAGFIPGKDPFGITQYGYPLDDPVFQQDPDEYWQKYCTDENYNLTNDWNLFAADESNRNPENFEPENPQTNYFASKVPGNTYGTNGCLLIQAAVGSAGAIFTDDVLSAEELADLAPPPSGGGGGGPFDCANAGDPATWADQSPGNPSQYRDLIEQNAPGRTCTDEQLAHTGFKTPSSAVPNDGLRQYFASCSDDCAIQGEKDGRKFIRVKYRDPPLNGNTIEIFVE